MYAVYCYAAGATAANVNADLIKLMTGETNKANLSADCVQANTSIVSTVPAGWTVYDSAAGGNSQVIRSLCADGTTYKYYKVNVSSTTVIDYNSYEGWNNTTHVGTNPTMPTAYGSGAWSSVNGGYFYMYVSNRSIVCLSFTSAAYQNINGALFFETTRDGILPGYPCFFQYGFNSNNVLYFGSTSSAFYSPRMKNNSSTGDVLSSSMSYSGIMMAQNCSSAAIPDTVGFYRDASEANNIAYYKIGISAHNAGSESRLGRRYLGEVYDVFCVASAVGSARDEFTSGGKTYVLHGNPAGSSLYLALPKE